MTHLKFLIVGIKFVSFMTAINLPSVLLRWSKTLQFGCLFSRFITNTTPTITPVSCDQFQQVM